MKLGILHFAEVNLTMPVCWIKAFDIQMVVGLTWIHRIYSGKIKVVIMNQTTNILVVSLYGVPHKVLST